MISHDMLTFHACEAFDISDMYLSQKLKKTTSIQTSVNITLLFQYKKVGLTPQKKNLGICKVDKTIIWFAILNYSEFSTML